MSFKNVILSSAAALALLSASANAALEMDGTGDYLLDPAVYTTANGEWTTDIKVVNTNTTNAVVARVVVRRSDNSDEIFDFPIYLTPGDVWLGTFKPGTGANAGKVVIYTEDDSSMLWATNQIIHADNGGMEITSNDPSKAQLSDPANRKVYVEIFGLASYDAATIAGIQNPLEPGRTCAFPGATTTGPNWGNLPSTITKGLDKTCMFDYVRGTIDGVAGSSINITSLNPSHATDVDNNTLMGKQVIFATNNAPEYRRAMAHNSLALGDMSHQPNTGIGVIGQNTTLQLMTGNANAAVNMMENALSKDKVYVMYEGDGTEVNPIRVHFTDPVKKYHFEISDQANHYRHINSGGTATTDYDYIYTIEGRDMEENVSRCAPPPPDNDDISGNREDNTSIDCNVSVPVELYTFGKEGTQQLDFSFPTGGYMTYDLDTNTSDRTPAVVPTSFTAKKINGMYLNNHLDNQYLSGQ